MTLRVQDGAVHRQKIENHAHTSHPEESELCLCRRHFMPFYSQFPDEVINIILKYEDGGSSAFIGRSDTNVISTDGSHDADGVPRARQRKEEGQEDIEEFGI